MCLYAFREALHHGIDGNALPGVVAQALSNLRLEIGRRADLIDTDLLAFCWVTDFPLVEYDDKEKRYQALLIEHLKKEILKELNSSQPDKDLAVFSDPTIMKTFFDDLKQEYQNGFYVNVSEERQELKQTAEYVGRYARRPPLSEVRIKDYTGEFVTFEFKDYRNGENKVLWTLKTIEFIGKIVRHIPPHYFNVIRHYGILASRVKAKYKKITDKLLTTPPATKKEKKWRERQTEFRGNDPLVCRICQTVMTFFSAYIPTSLSKVKDSFQTTFP